MVVHSGRARASSSGAAQAVFAAGRGSGVRPRVEEGQSGPRESRRVEACRAPPEGGPGAEEGQVATSGSGSGSGVLWEPPVGATEARGRGSRGGRDSRDGRDAREG